MKNKIPYIILLISITCSVWYYRANTNKAQFSVQLQEITYSNNRNEFTGVFGNNYFNIRKEIPIQYVNDYKIGKYYYITIIQSPDIFNFIYSMFMLLLVNAGIFLIINRERL